MNLQKIPFRQTHAFSEIFLRYIEKDPALAPFYSRYPSLDQFAAQIRDKSQSFPQATRKVLVDTLERQYKKLSKPSDPVTANVSSLLNKNTFTVTTGHQLNIFTGPLYFIYKIVTVIQACKQLRLKYPDHHFVPVYWMASEDHDYEEIKSFRLYGKSYTWETQQQGSVGRFHLKDMEKLMSQIPGDITIFRQAYGKASSLAEAVRSYVHALFGAEGLVVIDADDPELKNLLKPVIRQDLLDHKHFALVTKTQKDLEEKGFHGPVNPREINFFYLDHQIRSRIENRENDFAVVDKPLRFTKEEIIRMIEQHPEQFSPNVILRPLYQEMILPNLAYVGGPAELVYWLELKSIFDHYQIPFPILLPRNFAMVVDSPYSRKLEKTGLKIEDFFESKNFLFNHWITQHSSHNLSLGESIGQVEKIFSDIESRSNQIDQTLLPMVKAEAKRTRDKLEKIEKKMLRAEKRLHTDKIRQLEEVKDALFPGGGLQERTDNFLNFYQKDPSFVETMLGALDPFDLQFHVLIMP